MLPQRSVSTVGRRQPSSAAGCCTLCLRKMPLFPPPNPRGLGFFFALRNSAPSPKNPKKKILN